MEYSLQAELLTALACALEKCIELPSYFVLRLSEIKLTWSEGGIKEVVREESRNWVHANLCNRGQNFKGRKVLIRKTHSSLHSSVALGSSQKLSKHLGNTRWTSEIVCKPASQQPSCTLLLPPSASLLHAPTYKLHRWLQLSFHSAECCACIYMC